MKAVKKLNHKLSQLKAKASPTLYKAVYYGLVPAIVVIGKCLPLTLPTLTHQPFQDSSRNPEMTTSIKSSSPSGLARLNEPNYLSDTFYSILCLHFIFLKKS